MELLEIVIALLGFGLLHVTGLLDWSWGTIAVVVLIAVMLPSVVKWSFTLYFIAVILVNRRRRSKRKETK